MTSTFLALGETQRERTLEPSELNEKLGSLTWQGADLLDEERSRQKRLPSPPTQTQVDAFEAIVALVAGVESTLRAVDAQD